MTSFSKNEDCPSSSDLLEFQKSDLARTPARDISRHLASCEFCSAEVDFYLHYPQEEVATESIEATGIPAPLFELAEAILKNRQADSMSLNDLLTEVRTK